MTDIEKALKAIKELAMEVVKIIQRIVEKIRPLIEELNRIANEERIHSYPPRKGMTINQLFSWRMKGQRNGPS
jgi:hypothetical protein